MQRMVQLLGACGNGTLQADLWKLIEAKRAPGRDSDQPVTEVPMRPGWAAELVLAVLEHRGSPMRPGEVRQAVRVSHGVQLGHSTVMRVLRDSQVARDLIQRHPGSRYSLQ